MNIEITKPTRLLTGGKACPEDIDIIPVMQTKEVTKNGIVVPDSGYIGLSRVTVNVPEPPDTVLENIANPIMPKFGRLKYIEYDNGQSYVRYVDTFPAGTAHLATGVYTDSVTTTAETQAEADFTSHIAGAPHKDMYRIVCDGKVYDAHRFCSDIVAMWHIYGQNYNATLPMVYIPPCICRIVICDYDGDATETLEYVLNGLFLDALFQPSEEKVYSVALNYLNVHYTTGSPLTIGAEFIYEKHSITFSGGNAALKYSTDDGATFAAVTDGLAINQVEHVVFRNDSSNTAYLGSTKGGRDYLVLAPGNTFAKAIEADGTWYVS